MPKIMRICNDSRADLTLRHRFVLSMPPPANKSNLKCEATSLRQLSKLNRESFLKQCVDSPPPKNPIRLQPKFRIDSLPRGCQLLNATRWIWGSSRACRRIFARYLGAGGLLMSEVPLYTVHGLQGLLVNKNTHRPMVLR